MKKYPVGATIDEFMVDLVFDRKPEGGMMW